MSVLTDRRPPWDAVKLVSFDMGDASDMATGSFRQTPTLVGNANVANRVLVLDGSGDYVTYPDADFTSFTNGAGQDLPFSVSFWIKPASVSAAFIAGVGKCALTSGQYEWIAYTSRNDAGIKGPAFCLLNSTATQILIRGKAVNTMSAGTWYHVVYTYSGSETTAGLKVYQNAVQVDDTNLTVGLYAGMSNTTRGPSIGALGDGAQAFNGSIDDVRIYSRELSAAEVAAIYASTVGVSRP